MEDFVFDMGFEEFKKRPELKWSLAYAIGRGLSLNYDIDLLCDFSNGEKKYKGFQFLWIGFELSKYFMSFSKQKRLGLVIPPSFNACVSNYACIFSGKVPINLNFSLGRTPSKACIDISGIDTIITTRAVKERIFNINPQFVWTDNVVFIDEIIDELFSDIPIYDKITCDNILKNFSNDIDNNKEATIVFTSGSEEYPKGVILTERNIISNVIQTDLCGLFEDEDLLFCNLPIFHSFGLLFSIWMMAIKGQKVLSLATPIDIKSNIRAIKTHRPNVMVGSPTFFRPYLQYATREDMSSIRSAVAGAEKTPPGFHELFDNSFGSGVYKEGYGLTETTPVVGVNLPSREYKYFSVGTRKGSIGKIFPGMQARILSLSDLSVLPFGEQGLLSLRGPNVFGGYLGNEKATKKSLDGEWLITGDLARLDKDGFVYVDGRVSRFSKIAGEMISHTAVEGAIAKGLGVDDSAEHNVAISARLDESKGEVLVLLTTLDVSFDEIKSIFKKAGLSNLWMPKEILKLEKIPTLPTGKMDLRRMSEIASAKK